MEPNVAATGVHHLSNGMRVLTRELHHAPLASVMVWYGVGSRDERPGQTGISHFLEHMMFKGTPRFPYGALEEGVKRRGGMWNAFTSYDYTAYYEVLPSRHLEFGLEVEADRMVNMTFDEDLTVRERGIIVSEREGRENSPTFWLFEGFMASAYQSFPYRHQVLGSKEDIKATTAEALAAHYQKYYRPGNATLVVAGDFETAKLLELAEKHYGHIPAGEPVPPLTVVEPEQTEERRLVVRRPGPNPYLIMGYKIPEATHPDMPAISLLGSILSGASPFSTMGGGSGLGRSSRLQRNIVNKGIAAMASGSPWAFRYPGLFLCMGMPAPGVELERLEEALTAEVDSLASQPVSDEEFARAMKQVRAQYVYGMESTMNQAVMLGSTALSRSVEHFDQALTMLEQVTPDDVQRVAQTYLRQERRTVGWFQPEAGQTVSLPQATPDAGAAGTESTPAYQKAGEHAIDAPAPGKRRPIWDETRIQRRELPGGATLLIYPVATIPSAYLRIQLEVGAVHERPEQAGLAALTAAMLGRGSEAFSAEELAIKTDSLGMSIRFDSGRETVLGSLKCLPEDFAQGVGILAEVLRRPTFPEDEFERAKARMLAAVREAENDTRAVAGRRLAETLYPQGHPYRHSTGGTEQSLSGLSTDDLRTLHGRLYGLRDAVITVVGAVEPQQVYQALAEAFDGFDAGAGRLEIPTVTPGAASRAHHVIEGKSQTDIALGWPLVERTHPDYLALEVLATLFGGNGTPASSRLFRDVREKYGLSYYQFASFAASRGPGSWTAHIGVNPTRLDFAVKTLQQELERLTSEPAPADELQSLKDFLEDYPAVQHESPERIAGRLAELERFGLGLDYLERYPGLVSALTAEHLRDVAARHLRLDKLAIVTVGPEQES